MQASQNLNIRARSPQMEDNDHPAQRPVVGVKTAGSKLEEEVERIGFADLTVICEGKRIRAHRAFISQKSEPLRKALTDNYAVSEILSEAALRTLSLTEAGGRHSGVSI